MEYESQLGARALASAAREVAPPPCDLMSLRVHLEDCLSRARDVAARAEGIGDLVFGSVPADISSGRVIPAGPASIVETVADLDATITRINRALNRL